MSTENTEAPSAVAPRVDMRTPKWDPVPNHLPENPKKYYSADKRGFFSEELHAKTLPADAIEITAEQWAALLQAQAQGKEIAPGPDGKPVAIDPVVTPAVKRRRIEAQIDQLRTGPAMADAMRGTLLGKPGAKEQLAAIDAQMEALRQTIPPT